MKKYLTNCVNSTAELIGKMVDKAKEISYDQFIQHVDHDHLMEIFPFYDGIPLRIQDDYSVSFYQSKYEGKECVYVEHSRIEYIFVD